jgi:hypothetical protein
MPDQLTRLYHRLDERNKIVSLISTDIQPNVARYWEFEKLLHLPSQPFLCEISTFFKASELLQGFLRLPTPMFGYESPYPIRGIIPPR